jgi:hypothetical protein
VGVDAQRDMLEAFAEAASGAGVRSLGLVAGAWPGVAEETAPADVVVCGHVLYNVPDLAPFAHALDDHARRRVVIEITKAHPLAWMNDLWQRLHDLHRPDGPTAADAERALRELGLDVVREEQHERRDLGGFRRSEDAVAFVRRRLCLPASRDPELIEALGRRLRRRNGSWTAGPSEEKVVTLWWDRTDSRTRSALEPDVSA